MQHRNQSIAVFALIELRKACVPVLGKWDAEAANRGESAYVVGQFDGEVTSKMDDGRPCQQPPKNARLFGSVWDFYSTWRGKNNIGLNVNYASGPFAVTAFYEDVDMSNPVPAVLAENHKNWMLGGSWDAGVVKAYATYGQTTGKDSDYKIKTASLGATVPLGATSRILAAYAHSKLQGSDAKRDTVSVGYNYDFSKRTDAYAIVMYDKVKNFGSGTSVGVGVRHRF